MTDVDFSVKPSEVMVIPDFSAVDFIDTDDPSTVTVTGAAFAELGTFVQSSIPGIRFANDFPDYAETPFVIGMNTTALYLSQGDVR